MKPDIVITGLDRSGTTLMHLLVRYGFFDVDITDGEAAALETDVVCAYPHLCSKKTYDLMKMEKIIDELNAKIIWMVRDPRDCIVSKAAMNDFRQYWQRPIDLEKKLGGVRTLFENGGLSCLDGSVCIVKFEHLLIDPDGVQDELSFFLSLDKALPFSKCHRRFCEAKMKDGGKYICKLNGIRPLDASTTSKWWHPEHDEMWEDIYDDESQRNIILELTRLFNYEQDDKWFDRHIDGVMRRLEEEE